VNLLNNLHALLHEYNLKPNDNLGQNFLVSEEVLSKIISSLVPISNIIEVGAGIGFLTLELINKGKVLSYEIDKKLIPYLSTLQRLNLDFSFTNYLTSSDNFTEFSIVGNLPYLITNDCFKKFLTYQQLPKQIIIMVQKEVADKYLFACPKKEYLPLAYIYALYYKCEKIMDVTKTAFYPQPHITSTILKFDLINSEKLPKLSALIQYAFSHRRKTIYNNLKGYYPNIIDILDKAKVLPNSRAEELSLEDYRRIYNEI
jgi:16S rRNA (adenine1518-N6/adenine1519-N6)-dimethyltransferase